MNVYYVSENFCFEENENSIPNEKFWSAKKIMRIEANNELQAKEIYNKKYDY